MRVHEDFGLMRGVFHPIFAPARSGREEVGERQEPSCSSPPPTDRRSPLIPPRPEESTHTHIPIRTPFSTRDLSVPAVLARGGEWPLQVHRVQPHAEVGTCDRAPGPHLPDAHERLHGVSAANEGIIRV